MYRRQSEAEIAIVRKIEILLIQLDQVKQAKGDTKPVVQQLEQVLNEFSTFWERQ